MNEDALSEASRLLRSGEVIGLPTETVYGLAAAIDKPDAIARIFQLKDRPFFDPLIVHVASPDEVATVAAQVSAAEQVVMRRFWPGPLTLVLPGRSDLNPMICSGLDTVGVRCPAHPLARRVITAAGVPLAAPSANKFGKTSPTTPAHVREFWSEAELFVLDGGPCDVGLESSVVRVVRTDEGNRVEVLRPGLVTGEDIVSALRENGGFGTITMSYVESTASPGHVKHHYVPAIPLFIIPPDGVAAARVTPAILDQMAKAMQRHPSKVEELVLDRDARVAARLLYSSMRTVSENGADAMIVVRGADDSEEWRAIWDRLERAAAADLSGSK